MRIITVLDMKRKEARIPFRKLSDSLLGSYQEAFIIWCTDPLVRPRECLV